MKDKSFFDRMRDGADDFEKGLRLLIEAKHNALIYPIEQLPRKDLVNKLDFVGVDAFIMDKGEEEMYGLGSRVNYAWFKDQPSFSFRYALWDERNKKWKEEREYHRKLRVANHPEKQIFPTWHVESFSRKRGSGDIAWAYMAKTKDILNYIEATIIKGGELPKGINGVKFEEPKTKERRLVVYVPIKVLLEKGIDVREIVREGRKL